MRPEASVLCGVLPVYKEEGFTSNDVVAKLRGILHMKKIGHTGTLDPAATGVLPVCLGKATKIISLLEDTDKTYKCRCRLGVLTDTEDMTGNIVETADVSGITQSDIIKTLDSFTGRYMQVPPMYSAKKVGGKKLYELARQGVEIERKPCEVFIRRIEAGSFEPEKNEFTFLVECSKGTYVRSLCRDIGQRLGTKASMAELQRTAACGFIIDECVTLAQTEELFRTGEIEGSLTSIDSMFPSYEKLKVRGGTEKKVRNGNVFIMDVPDGKYRIYLGDGTFAAVYEVRDKRAHLCGYFLT